MNEAEKLLLRDAIETAIELEKDNKELRGIVIVLTLIIALLCAFIFIGG